MKYFKVLLLISLLPMKVSYGQTGMSDTARIRAYMLWVDTLASDHGVKLHENDTFKNVRTFLDEGAAYSRERGVQGHYRAYTTSDDKLRTVYKIVMQDDIQKFCIRNYYYSNNQLVYASHQLQDRSKGQKVLYLSYEYYAQGILIYKVTPVDNVKKKDRWRTETGLSQSGEAYLARYINEREQQAALAARAPANGARPFTSRNTAGLAGNFSGKYKYKIFTPGKIYYRNGDSAAYRLNLNYIYETMELMGSDGKITPLKDPETIKYIVAGKDIFYYEKGYLELIKQTSVARLALRKTYKANTSAMGGFWAPSGPYTTGRNMPAGGRMTFYSPKYVIGDAGNGLMKADTAYFISDSRTPFERASRKNVARMFAEKNRMTGKYFASKKVNMNKMQDLKDLIDYISGIDKDQAGLPVVR